MTEPLIIVATPPAKCELCSAEAELRPYGPNGEKICFDCGMKDEKTTITRMHAHLFGDSK